MGLLFEFNDGWDPQNRKKIEDAVRKCVGQPRNNDKWFVSVTTGFSGQFCEVQVMTPNQTRSHLFFEDPANLAEAIADWISMYPLR